jgi:hypothetical protein
MWHPYGDLTRNWSALDRDCAADTCHDIEWDDHRWNGCASSALSHGTRFVFLLKTHGFRAESACSILLRAPMRHDASRCPRATRDDFPVCNPLFQGGLQRKRASLGVGVIDQTHDRHHVGDAGQRRLSVADAVQNVEHEGPVMRNVCRQAADQLALT